MITLQRPDSAISALIGEKKKIKEGDMLYPSQFVVCFELGERKVIFNTLTGHCIESRYWDWFEDRHERPYDENDAEMKALVRRDFLVASNVDEATRYGQIIKMARAMEHSKSGYTAYTILPTTACNARCDYCFEAGIDYETMSDEIVEQTIRYIHKTRREGTHIQLSWFGGEPLLGEGIIDRICAAMRDANVSYSSSMISNGSLMTEELVLKANEDWHLRKVQITLDGREEVYCERKRYVNFKGSPYRSVLDAIHAMTGQEIAVIIRLNIDEENADELMALVDELDEEFKLDRGITAYCHRLFENENGVELRDESLLYEKMERLNERLHIFNQKHRARRDEHITPSQNYKTSFYDRCEHIKRFYCMMDFPDAGGVIMPNGDILLCEYVNATPVAGSVFDESIVQREKHVERGREREEECSACPLLPDCTDFMSCPNRKRNCVTEFMADLKRNLMWLSNEKRLPPITVDIDGEIIRIVEPSPEFAERCTPLLTDYYRKADVTLTQDEAISKYHL